MTHIIKIQGLELSSDLTSGLRQKKLTLQCDFFGELQKVILLLIRAYPDLNLIEMLQLDPRVLNMTQERFKVLGFESDRMPLIRNMQNALNQAVEQKWLGSDAAGRPLLMALPLQEGTPVAKPGDLDKPIIVCGLDCDGALLHQRMQCKDGTVDFARSNPSFMAKLTQYSREARLVILVSASLRQSYNIEMFNALIHFRQRIQGYSEREALGWVEQVMKDPRTDQLAYDRARQYIFTVQLQVIMTAAQQAGLNNVIVDPVLLADLIGDGLFFAHGRTLTEVQKAMKAGSEGSHGFDWSETDQSKISLLFFHLNYFKVRYNASIYKFIDDRDDILRGVAEYFSQHPKCIPLGLKLECHQYEDGTYKGWRHSITGEGAAPTLEQAINQYRLMKPRTVPTESDFKFASEQRQQHQVMGTRSFLPSVSGQPKSTVAQPNPKAARRLTRPIPLSGSRQDVIQEFQRNSQQITQNLAGKRADTYAVVTLCAAAAVTALDSPVATAPEG